MKSAGIAWQTNLSPWVGHGCFRRIWQTIQIVLASQSHPNVHLMVALSTGVSLAWHKNADIWEGKGIKWNFWLDLYEKTMQFLKLQIKWGTKFISDLSPSEQKSNLEPSLLDHIPLQAPFMAQHNSRTVSQSASQYEPNLICGTDVWAAMRQAESHDVTALDLHSAYLLRGAMRVEMAERR